jgi:hypothetical protein
MPRMRKSKVTLASEFLKVETNVCGQSVWNLLSFSLLATTILRWFLDFFENVYDLALCVIFKKCQKLYREPPLPQYFCVHYNGHSIMFRDQLCFVRIRHPAVIHKIREKAVYRNSSFYGILLSLVLVLRVSIQMKIIRYQFKYVREKTCKQMIVKYNNWGTNFTCQQFVRGRIKKLCCGLLLKFSVLLYICLIYKSCSSSNR